jgi:hypothetical protein
MMKRRLNISIDDVSPHRLSGLDVLVQCDRIIADFPTVKFSLFVPTAYWRTMYIHGKPDTRTRRPLYLVEHPDFCDRLRALSKDNFEVCYHGRHHGIPGVSNNDEFRYMNSSEFAARFVEMEDDVAAADLFDVFVPVIRPPAMWMSPDAIQTARLKGIECFALSPRPHHMASYGDAIATRNDDVVYANVWVPDDDLDTCVDADIELLYHACTWDPGHFDFERADELLSWLHDNDVEFCFIRDLLEHRDG